jgi:ATP-dependent DNA helicase RecG
MKSRNPVLHYVFARMGMAEEQGFGLTSLKKHAEKLGLPLPRYSMEGDSLVLTIYRSKAGAVAGLPSEVLETLNSDERKGWEFLTTKSSVTRREYAEQLGFDDRKAQRHLKRFVELGLLQKVGASSSTEYEVRKP